MLTQQAAVAQVKAFAAEVRRLNVPLRQVILFGSYARNEQREDSDIDVALIADDFTGASFIDIARFAELFGRYTYIEAHTFATSKFSHASPLAEEIRRSGIVMSE
jgi:uncharacterized protein